IVLNGRCEHRRACGLASFLLPLLPGIPAKNRRVRIAIGHRYKRQSLGMGLPARPTAGNDRSAPSPLVMVKELVCRSMSCAFAESLRDQATHAVSGSQHYATGRVLGWDGWRNEALVQISESMTGRALRRLESVAAAGEKFSGIGSV